MKVTSPYPLGSQIPHWLLCSPIYLQRIRLHPRTHPQPILWKCNDPEFEDEDSFPILQFLLLSIRCVFYPLEREKVRVYRVPVDMCVWSSFVFRERERERTPKEWKESGPVSEWGSIFDKISETSFEFLTLALSFCAYAAVMMRKRRWVTSLILFLVVGCWDVWMRWWNEWMQNENEKFQNETVETKTKNTDTTQN